MAITQTPEMREQTLAKAKDKLCTSLIGFDLKQIEDRGHPDSDSLHFREIIFSKAEQETFAAVAERLQGANVHFFIHLLEPDVPSIISRRLRFSPNERDVLRKVTRAMFGKNASSLSGLNGTNLGVTERYEMDNMAVRLSYGMIDDADYLRHVLDLNLVTKSDVVLNIDAKAKRLDKIEQELQDPEHEAIVSHLAEFNEKASREIYLEAMNEIVHDDEVISLMDAWQSGRHPDGDYMTDHAIYVAEIDLNDEIATIVDRHVAAYQYSYDRTRAEAIDARLIHISPPN